MDNGSNIGKQGNNGLKSYLSPAGVWALALGCAVGWGSFVMPGTTFLPAAGPLGTALGILIGTLVILVIGINYYYLMNRYEDAGGAFTYAVRIFGHDHGFVCSWFLLLVYIAIAWANVTALVLIGRNLFGDLFKFGFHYRVISYDVYAGEVLISVLFIAVLGSVCAVSKRAAVLIQTICAGLLCLGILISFIFVISYAGGFSDFKPAFSPNGKNPAVQVFGIIVLAPWAFIGFESITHSSEEFRFPVRKTLGIIVSSLAVGALLYIMLAETAAAIRPEGYPAWSDYINDLGSQEGLRALPAFYATTTAMGSSVGTLLLGVTALAGIITGLIGNFIAASRLLYAMTKERILPEWLGRLSADGNPGNAFIFLTLISLPIPFLGRTAIGWIVDVNTIGAIIAYGYTSAAAYKCASEEKNRRMRYTGIAGLVFSAVFFLYFMMLSAGAMSTESFLILIIWSVAGFVYFRHVFSRDKERHFGRSTVVWTGLLFLIFFTSLLWIRRATNDMTTAVIGNISSYYEERDTETGEDTVEETRQYLKEQMEGTNRVLNRNSIIQMGIMMAALGIMISIYGIMSRREREMDSERLNALESSRAKSAFLSNMSHDIRTPMNAIIGYINLSRRDDITVEELKENLGKIESSSQHLLALINDVLEMSRIESGKMDLEPVEMDLCKALSEVRDMFLTQMELKHISFTVDHSGIKDCYVLCDKNRLNRVLLNLISNAYKFTPEGGTVAVKAVQLTEARDNKAGYELRVSDSGIGMTKEFAEKVFEAFERERTSTVSGIQGTGLGMAITKSIVDLMGGTIKVNTEPGKGTEFVIVLELELCEGGRAVQKEVSTDKVSAPSVDFTGMRLLLVEDMVINREIAMMMLTSLGFYVDTAENGKEAVDRIAESEPGYYSLVLMDIQMPVMDGYDAARAIRNLKDTELSSIPIIAMTANAFSEDVKRAKEAGMNGHIAKPIDVNVMTDTIKEVLTAQVQSEA